ncbi:S8 family serine peptidase [Streptomyces bobili]
MEVRSILRGIPQPEELLGDPNVCVAVLDGPVDLSHPCFAGADVTRINTLVRDPAGRGPMSLHGTHVASLLLGQRPSRVAGLAPRCRGLILPIFRDGQEGRVPQLDLARAVERAVEEGAHVINISGGERSADGQAESMLDRALQMCADRGVLVVAAVGNDGCDCLQAPAAAPSVLAVGATGTDSKPLESNNWGIAYRTNGVLAPGQDIEGAAPGGGQAALTGSSFATPVVAGLAALLVAEQLRQGLKADPIAAGKAILETALAPPCSPPEAVECRRKLVGHINATRAYQLIRRHKVSESDLEASQAASASVPATAWPTRAIPSGASVTPAGVLPSPQISHPASDERVTIMDINAAHAPADEDAPPAGRTEQLAQAAPSPTSHDRQDVQQEELGSPAGVGAAGETASLAMQSREPNDEGHDTETHHSAGAGDASAAGTEKGAVPSASHPAAAASGGSERMAGVRPSCGCGESTSGCQCGENGNDSHPQLIYAIGTIGYDFGTEARRDSFRQLMPNIVVEDPGGGPEQEVQPNIYDPAQMHAYLTNAPQESGELIWTLKADAANLYALEAEEAVGMDWTRPIIDPKASAAKVKQSAIEAASDPHKLADLLETLSHPPVSPVYRTFRDAILGQIQPEDDPTYVSRVSIPGVLTGRTVKTFAGEELPVVKVQSRGLYTWNEAVLVNAVVDAVTHDYGTRKPSVTLDDDRIGTLKTTIRALLDMLYWRFRNLGQTSADRAMNAAGTNAFLVGSELKNGLLSAKHVPGKDDNFYTLESIKVAKSAFCRPRPADCHDVTLTFFDPENDRRARVSYLLTFDVALPNPVSIGPPHKFIGGF